MKDHLQHALVLSGGGAKGAYEVGVMKALFEGASSATNYKPLDIHIYTGTSVGAYNAAFMASKVDTSAAAAVDNLEQIWRHRMANTLESCGNGVFRIRGFPGFVFDPSCLLHPLQSLEELIGDGAFFANYAIVRGTAFASSELPIRDRLTELVDLSALFSVEPLHALIRETVDLAGLRRSESKLTIASTNWENGRVSLFSKADIADRFGHKAILASTAIPGIFPPVDIEGVEHVDGGLVMNTPLKPSFIDGADVIHVIYLDPLVQQIQLRRLPNSAETVYRMFAILLAKQIDEDLLEAARINAALEELRHAGRLEQVANILLRPVKFFTQPRMRLITVHRYRPPASLGGMQRLLDFSSSEIVRHIERGYQDASIHQCQEEGCLVPGITQPTRQSLRGESTPATNATA